MDSKEARFLMYRAAENEVAVNALLKDDTIWLNQKGMAELFDCSSDNISQHLKKIFAEGELVKETVTEKISATAADGKNYMTQFYNLDAIISVGYRVNSRRATAFRIWATSFLREYMLKGFAMDVRCFFGTFVSVMRRDGVVEGGTGELSKHNEKEKKEV